MAVDAAHRNVNTLRDRYAALGELLAADGCVVRSLDPPFDAAALAGVDVLVISNARPAAAGEGSATGDAFAPAEVAALVAFVEAGGGLLVAADHMPAPGWARGLAAAFGVEVVDGFVHGPGGPAGDAGSWSVLVFDREGGGLADHPVTRGRAAGDRVEAVATFTGSALRAEGAASLLTLPRGAVALLPAAPWKFDDATPRRDVGGWSQAVVLERGEGRAAFLAEAAMITSMGDGRGGRLGFDHPRATHNARFARNLVRWLAGR